MGTMNPLVNHITAVLVLIAEIPVSTDNVCSDENENQYVTSPSSEALGRNVNVRRSKRIRNSPQQYNLVFGAAR